MRARAGSGSQVKLVLASSDIPRPVDVVRALASFGVPLKAAREALDRLASGDSVPLEVSVSDDQAVVAELARLNISARVVEQPVANVHAVRQAGP